jgi:hypothetical protein
MTTERLAQTANGGYRTGIRRVLMSGEGGQEGDRQTNKR